MKLFNLFVATSCQKQQQNVFSNKLKMGVFHQVNSLVVATYRRLFNEGISAVSLCHQVAASVPDMFCNFYLVKNH
jgi:hypothetical protein